MFFTESKIKPQSTAINIIKTIFQHIQALEYFFTLFEKTVASSRLVVQASNFLSISL
jgi:hypothetical protein